MYLEREIPEDMRKMSIMRCFCRWVEFANKSIAKRVAKMLNGQEIGAFPKLHLLIL